MFDNISITNPGAFAVLPFVIGAWAYARLARRKPATLISDAAIAARTPRTLRQILAAELIWLEPLALIALTIAASRPRRVSEQVIIQGRGVAIMMCVDTSLSMAALDFKDLDNDDQTVPRIRVVKKMFQRFVAGDGENLKGRPSDMIGLVSFGGFAEGRCPLTLDHDSLLEILDALDTPKPMYDRRGRMINEKLFNEESSTAIGDALVMSVARLKDVKAKSKIVILLSDGVSNAGVTSTNEAIDLAKQNGFRVYAIGIGKKPTGGFLFRPQVQMEWPLPDGSVTYRPVNASLDDKELKRIASETGGVYFHVEQTEQLAKVYQQIDDFEKVDMESAVSTRYEDLLKTPLAIGLALLLIGVCGPALAVGRI
ncbi:MAG: VWA domain-containing protein [Planctomycetota bacterium]